MSSMSVDATPTYHPRDLPAFIGSGVLSTVAMQVQSVAIGWQIYDIEHMGGFLFAAGPLSTYSACLAALVLAGFLTASLGGRRVDHSHALEGTALPADASRWDRVVEGIRFVRARPIVLGAISLDLFAVLLGGAVALLPVFARDILHVGPMGLGLLCSAPAAGAAVMAFVLAHRPIERRSGTHLFVAVAIFGLATVAFGLSRDFYLSLAALFVTGASDMISVFIRSTLINFATPDPMRGRVGAVNMLFVGASGELGEFESGMTAAWFGTVPAVIIGGIGTLAIVAAWMWLFPPLRKADRLTEALPASGWHVPSQPVPDEYPRTQ